MTFYRKNAAPLAESLARSRASTVHVRNRYPVPPPLLSSPPPAMAALIKSAVRRLPRGPAMMDWRQRILGVVLLTTLITTFLIWDIPNPLGGDPLSTSSSASSPVEPITADRLAVEDILPLPPPPPHVIQPRPRQSRRSATTDPSSTGVDTRPTRRRRRRGRRRPRPAPSPPPPPPVVSDPSVPFSLEKAYWRMKPDEALMYAKQQIEQAPIVTNDVELYAPLFKNLSAFKRSYELMERILKVYIYPDGDRPIFHTPELQGIYASEGWFMQLMEESRKFVVNDPSKAHLFYLPYSARQLQLALYVPGSHNLKPLSLFLRDYVNTLSSKYPFWNRTGGADHFLVACHDWGSYTTTEHAQLCKTTIKALCNADISEGIFVRGKDVSLPETAVREPMKPLRFVGGQPVSKRPILAFFAGTIHGRVRPILMKHWDGKDEDIRIYGPLPDQVTRKMSYIHHMKSSRFCLCPMGLEVNSPRIVEAIYYECVPVIIADNFVLPLEEVLDWSAFSVVVPEKDIPNLKDILMKISLRKYMTLHMNVVKLQKHFLWHASPIRYDMFHMILHSIWFNRVNQIQAEVV